MAGCLNAVGFVFDSVKTYIKKDKIGKYTNYYCQNCAFQSETNSCDKSSSTNPYCETPLPGIISPCNKCTNNSQYKICIFKLKKEHFVSSSLGIATGDENAWELFKNAIIYQRNGNFVISVTSGHDDKSNSFYANLIKAKKCDCCEAVILYFKYNVISLLPPYLQGLTHNIPPDVQINTYFPYNVACANQGSNIAYNLKSCNYKNVKFFYSPNYTFKTQLLPPWVATQPPFTPPCVPPCV
jgi:hypothetical protein